MNNINEIYNSLEPWRSRQRLKTLMFIMSLLPVCLGIQLLVDGYVGPEENKAAKIFVHFAIGIVLLCMGFFFLISQRRIEARNKSREYWKIDLGMHTENEIISLLEKRLQITEVSEECRYGKAVRNDNWQVYIFTFRNDDHYNDLMKVDYYYSKVNQMTGFSIENTIRNHEPSARLNIMIYDAMPQAFLKSICDRVTKDIVHRQSVLNVLISLEEETMYIPAIIPSASTVNHIDPYLTQIRRVQRFFEL